MTTTLDSRNKILNTASNLFKIQGYHATGLNQIIKESGAPKGSIYHYFPNGKEELAIESIKLTSQCIQKFIRDNLSLISDPIESIEGFLKKIANEFNPEEIHNGISISLLALETALISEPLRNACQSAVESWENLFTEKLMEGGFDKQEASELGMTIHLLIEGATTLSLTKKNNKPFLVIANQISTLLARK